MTRFWEWSPSGFLAKRITATWSPSTRKRVPNPFYFNLLSRIIKIRVLLTLIGRIRNKRCFRYHKWVWETASCLSVETTCRPHLMIKCCDKTANQRSMWRIWPSISRTQTKASTLWSATILRFSNPTKSSKRAVSLCKVLVFSQWIL